MVHETRKIMGDDSIDVCPTCVRVPVLYSHSESILVETERPITPEAARELWSRAPGVTVVDDPEGRQYPLPASAEDRDDVFVGRIRADLKPPERPALLVRQRQPPQGGRHQRRPDRRGTAEARPGRGLSEEMSPLARSRRWTRIYAAPRSRPRGQARPLLSIGGRSSSLVVGALCSIDRPLRCSSRCSSRIPSTSDARVARSIGILMFGRGRDARDASASGHLAAGNLGKILRYQYGETPAADDGRRTPCLTRGSRTWPEALARSLRDVWTEGETPPPDREWPMPAGRSNDADDVFCKGCGQRLTGQVCPSCQASNDADARFCDRCGATMAAGA